MARTTRFLIVIGLAIGLVGCQSFNVRTDWDPGVPFNELQRFFWLEPPEVEAMLADAVFGTCQAGATARPLTIPCVDGRQLPSGVVARWPR